MSDSSDARRESSLLTVLTERRVIGEIKAIDSVDLQVALKSGQNDQAFKISKELIVLRNILHLYSGHVKLRSIRFLVADEELAAEELLIGLTVLSHLKMDTSMLLEATRPELDGID